MIDGGALLHKVKWLPKSSYGDIADSYLQFVSCRYKKYSDVCIVFDGYTDELSNKAEEQLRRYNSMSADIKFNERTDVTTTREMFLRNSRNKESFINFLAYIFQRAGFAVVKSTGDADVLIARTSIEYAATSNVVICADDTDILVLLSYHYSDGLHEMCFSTETKEGNKSRSSKFWSVRKMVDHGIGLQKASLIFFFGTSSCLVF